MSPFDLSMFEVFVFAFIAVAFLITAHHLARFANRGPKSVTAVRWVGAAASLSIGLWYVVVLLLSFGVLPIGDVPSFDLIALWTRFSNSLVLVVFVLWAFILNPSVKDRGV